MRLIYPLVLLMLAVSMNPNASAAPGRATSGVETTKGLATCATSLRLSLLK